MMICGFFTVFWLSFFPLLLPTLGIAASYSTTGSTAEGVLSQGYNAGIALYLVTMGCAEFTFFVFALKTNVVLVLLNALATTATYLLASAYFNVSNGNFAKGTTLQYVLLLSRFYLFWVGHEVCADDYTPGCWNTALRGCDSRLVYDRGDHSYGSTLSNHTAMWRFV